MVAALASPAPAPTTQTTSSTYDSIASGSQTLSPRSYSYAAIFSGRPSIDGYSHILQSPRQQTRSIFPPWGDLIYVSVSISSSAGEVSSIKDSSYLTWVLRERVQAHGLALETWYSTGVLNHDDVSVTDSSPVEFRVNALAVSGVNTSAPFSGSATYSSGVGSNGSTDVVSTNGSAKSIFIVALGASGNQNVSEVSPFKIVTESGPPSVATELYGPASNATSAESGFSISPGGAWALIAEVVSLSNQVAGKHPKLFSIFGAPEIALCYSVSGAGAANFDLFVLNAAQLIALINGYGYPTMSPAIGLGIVPSPSTEKCYDALIPVGFNGSSYTVGNYYLVAYNPGPASVYYTLVSYLVNSASLNKAFVLISSQVAPSSSSSSPADQFHFDWSVESIHFAKPWYEWMDNAVERQHHWGHSQCLAYSSKSGYTWESLFQPLRISGE